MRKGKSSGVDGLSSEILIKIWENATKQIGEVMNMCQIHGRQGSERSFPKRETET